MADIKPVTGKVWKASRNANAAMTVDENLASMVSHDNIVAVNQFGTTIAGPISLATDAANIRRGMLFTGLNDFLAMIPSTIITPFPLQVPVPPIHGVIGITKDVAFFMSLLV